MKRDHERLDRTCTGGHLQPVALWELVHEATPAGMLHCREV